MMEDTRYDGYINLCNSIIMQAIYDYRYACLALIDIENYLKDLKSGKKNLTTKRLKKAKKLRLFYLKQKEECTAFFCGKFIEKLTTINKEELFKLANSNICDVVPKYNKVI